MARLFLDQEPLTQYKDRSFQGSMDEYLEKLRTSTTLYVGNVSFFTTEEQIWELFAKVGVLRTIVMGLDKNAKTPCGFSFVEYHNRKDAEKAVKYLNGTKLVLSAPPTMSGLLYPKAYFHNPLPPPFPWCSVSGRNNHTKAAVSMLTLQQTTEGSA